MRRFRSMGCEVIVDRVALAPVRKLFWDRDRRFSRFLAGSELNRVNHRPLGVTVVSEDFAELLAVALSAARATRGLVTPAVGAALEAAGYDRDYGALRADGAAVQPVAVPTLDALALDGQKLLRREAVVLDLNGVVKSRTVDDALALGGRGWVSAGGDVATIVPISVGLPAGGRVRLERGGLATSSTHVRRWRRGGRPLHHLIDPRTGTSSRSRWLDVTVAAATCLAADVAAKGALLLDDDGPAWLDERGLAGRFVGPDGRRELTDAWPRGSQEVAA